MKPTSGFGLNGGSGDAHGEHEAVAFGRIVGHGVGADRCLGVDALEVEQTEFLPCRQILLANRGFVDVFVVIDREGWNLDLSVGAGDEVHVLAFGECHYKFLDECGDIVVRHHGALVFLDVEHFGRNLDVEVALHFHLAGESPVVFNLLAGEMYGFGGENLAATFGDAHLALAAAAFAAAGRGEENVFGGQGREKRTPGFDAYLAVVVDGDGHFARADQEVLGHEEHYNQQKGNH